MAQHVPLQPYESQPYDDDHTVPLVRGVPQTTAKSLSTVPWFLFALMGLMLAVVIGLGAGLGIEAGRANHAETQLEAALGKKTQDTSSANGTYDDITRNCSSHANTVSGSTYASFPYTSGVNYTIYCYESTTTPELMTLFTADFDGCMDACAAYTRYAAALQLVNDDKETPTCASVTFTPGLTNKTVATEAAAGGNCLLGPAQNASDLAKSTLQGELQLHAALLNP